MPRRSILSAAERASLLLPPDTEDELIRHYAFGETDLSKVVNVGVRDSTYVLDGLLYHESDLRIEEHYTDTAGFTDHVFALMHLLGFRFAPRIRDLGDTKLYIPKGEARNALARAVFFNRLGEIRDRRNHGLHMHIAGICHRGQSGRCHSAATFRNSLAQS